MAGFNPTQPRDDDGRWTVAGSSVCGVEYKDD